MRRAVLLLGVLAVAATQPAFACGKSAKADGSDREWDRTADFVKHMHKDGNESGTEMTDLNLRCDPVSGKAHALVMAKPGYTLEDSADAWVKVDGQVVANKNTKDFAWIVKNGQRVGYECSFNYDYSKDHVIRAKAKVKSYRHYFAHYDYSDSGDHHHHFECQVSPPATGNLTAACGDALVDGTVEAAWNVGTAQSYEMKSGTTTTANLYVRYKDGTGYVLVLVKQGFTAYNYADLNKVTVDGRTVITPSSTSFKWVKSGYNLIGYEASFPLTPGQKLAAQVKTLKNYQFLIATNLDQTVVANCGSTGGSQCPTGKTAKIDGVLGDNEWDWQNDLVSPLLNDGTINGNTAQSGNLYVRYDGRRFYVLALASATNVAINYPSWNFVTLNGSVVVQATSSNYSNTTTSFAWVYSGGKLVGYEASFVPAAAVGTTATVGAQLKTAPAAGGYYCTHYRAKGSGSVKTQCPPVVHKFGIGNRVWKELNNTFGYQSGADEPIAGVVVQVRDHDGNLVLGPDGLPLQSTTRTGDGCYLIEGLPEGDYYASIPMDVNQAKLNGLEVAPNSTGSNGELLGNDEVTDDNADHNGYQYDATIDANIFHLSTIAPTVFPFSNETGAACPNLRTLPDEYVNETADFAFIVTPIPVIEVALGNLVWIDKDGKAGYNPTAGDSPREGVTLELRNPDGTLVANVDPVRTDENGCYLFDKLPEGTYYVRIPESNFAVNGALKGYTLPGAGGAVGSYGDDEVTDDGGNLDADGNPFADQNGRKELTASGAIVSNQFTLKAGDEPKLERGSACGARASALPDDNVNLTADFAFEDKVAVGNFVWIERNGLAGYQDGGTTPDERKDGVLVELWRVDDKGTPDQSDDTFTAAGTQTTRNGGYFLFDNLSPGTYYLHIPQSMFDVSTAPLFGYEASQDVGGDVAVDDGSDQNGVADVDLKLNGISTRYFDLQAGTEPTALDESGQVSSAAVSDGTGLKSALPDESVDLTKDFSFVQAGGSGSGLLSIGSTLWIDVNWNGIHEAGEPVIKDVRVEVYKASDTAGLPVDFAITDSEGVYRIGELEEGDYKVKIPNTTDGVVQVNAALSYYYANRTTGGRIPTSVATKALSTTDIADQSDADSRVDGDDNGLQVTFGEEVWSPVINLKVGKEPVDGDPTLDIHAEYLQSAGSNGHLRDSGDVANGNYDVLEDANGDMTVDFGFVHQCQVICDVNGNGQVDADDLAQIRTKYLAALEVSPPGTAHSGDCDGSGAVGTNDYQRCGVLKR